MFETVWGQLQLRSLKTLGSAPAGAANPREVPRTITPLNNIFVITQFSVMATVAKIPAAGLGAVSVTLRSG